MKKISTNLLCGNHGDVGTILAAFVELHHAVDESIQRVISAHANILAGVVGGTALTDNDIAGDALLTTKDFNA